MSLFLSITVNPLKISPPFHIIMRGKIQSVSSVTVTVENMYINSQNTYKHCFAGTLTQILWSPFFFQDGLLKYIVQGYRAREYKQGIPMKSSFFFQILLRYNWEIKIANI